MKDCGWSVKNYKSIMNKMKNNKIDKVYYEQIYYSDMNRLMDDVERRLRDFHYYRIHKVLNIYTPSINEDVLDLGCAWGTFSLSISEYCKNVFSVDFSEKVLRCCRQRSVNLDKKNVKVICADVENIGIKNNSIDVIISADLFEHLYPKDFLRVLDECKRVLRKGGKLVVWTPNKGHIIEFLKNRNIILRKDESHVDYKRMDYMVKELEKRGFIILKRQYEESHIPLWNILEKAFLRYAPFLRRRIAILAENR